MNDLTHRLEEFLDRYRGKFVAKVFDEREGESDLLKGAFLLTPATKNANRQYWGRELGYCWQLLVDEVFKSTHPEWKPGIRLGSDSICDLVVGRDAIDTKYQIGSGDSGTLKKFRSYGMKLRDLKYRPVLLILRTDNLAAAIMACRGWTIFQGDEAFA